MLLIRSETEFISAKIIPPFDEQPMPEPIPGKPKPPDQPIPIPGKPEPSVCSLCGQEPCICPKKETISLRVPPKTSLGSLREETAVKLQQYESAEIIKVSYKIFYQQENIGDLNTLPASLRGNLSGQGDVTAEISITKTGRFSKSQVEQQIESLPSIAGADYSVDITLEADKKGA